MPAKEIALSVAVVALYIVTLIVGAWMYDRLE